MKIITWRYSSTYTNSLYLQLQLQPTTTSQAAKNAAHHGMAMAMVNGESFPVVLRASSTHHRQNDCALNTS
jgi:hypothetical protein